MRNEQQIAEGRQELHRGHLEFDADVFKNCGGAAIAMGMQLSQKRGFNSITAQPPVQTPGQLALKDAKDAAGPGSAKKAKHFQVDKEMLAVIMFIEGRIKAVRASFAKSVALAKAAKGLAEVAADVPELQNYVLILDRRLLFAGICSIDAAVSDGGFSNAQLGPFTPTTVEAY